MKIITEGIDIRHGQYRCPWQSIHLITSDVPDDLRWDKVVDSGDLLNIDLLTITNDLKRVLYRYAGRKLTDPRKELDPGRLNYDGWTVEIHDTFMSEFGKKIRPFKFGFCLASKPVKDIPGLWVVSIAVTITSH